MGSGSQRRRSIQCSECGAYRQVSLEHAIRVAKGVHSDKCELCRNPAPISVQEEHRVYWLRKAGVTAPLAGPTGAAQYVLTNGLPDALRPIVASSAFGV